ncbi:MarR family winged helix-turn-helix transcriptional regulator [Novosphingobium sp.]|uniref:MarR family winged helix-turn-helix transcriptional regulator n=1 Tax=Novosphingobium sp. TaxID=1874826 RepID=UPI002735A37E|nr:MarR family winged helix-turn-helix transcriptional regulator [Novosphingobium sp.]MDP3908670.1 MarR family winged helix-turn-helix transcriptional regulator [Novosphingobium sp.]
MQAQDMAGHLIRRLHQLSTQIYTARTREAGFDITSVQFAALDAISANPGIDQAGVAALIAYDRPTIGEVINRLVAKGLVERAINDADRRARVLRLTPDGLDVFQRLLPIVSDLQSAILGNLPPDDRAAFLALAKSAIRDA